MIKDFIYYLYFLKKYEIKIIEFKSIGLSSKIFIKSRVIRFITEKSDFENDEITYGLLQQISGDLKEYKPIEMKYDESEEIKIQKILEVFNS